FDLCIELISDSRREHITRDTQDKRTEYAHAGVTEYFILDDSRPPRPNETAFYRLNPSGIYQPIQPVNGIIACSVLPEFQFRREHLLTQPDVITLLDDPVYQGYILPHVRAERLEKEREREEKERERERADELMQALVAERTQKEQLHTYTEQLHAYLASIGVDLPDNLKA
ncbi:MAG: Uma2 family endonuclease, partial [Chloroflexota bacterium]